MWVHTSFLETDHSSTHASPRRGLIIHRLCMSLASPGVMRCPEPFLYVAFLEAVWQGTQVLVWRAVVNVGLFPVPATGLFAEMLCAVAVLVDAVALMGISCWTLEGGGGACETGDGGEGEGDCDGDGKDEDEGVFEGTVIFEGPDDIVDVGVGVMVGCQGKDSSPFSNKSNKSFVLW